MLIHPGGRAFVVVHMINLAVVHVPSTPRRQSGLQLIGELSGTRKLETHPVNVGVIGMLGGRRLAMGRPGSVREWLLPLLLIHDSADVSNRSRSLLPMLV